MSYQTLGLRAWSASLLSFFVFFACGGTETPQQPGQMAPAGGTTSSGGQVLTGGSSATGGSGSGGVSTGGQTASGGSQGGGGTPMASGGEGSGGFPTSGGASGTGGDASGGSGGMMNQQGTTYVYVGSGDFGDEPGMVSVYTLNRETYQLSFVSDVQAGALASFLAIDSERARLYSVDETGGGVQSFSIDPQTGELSSLGVTPHSNQPVYLSLTRDGQYLLAANYNQGSVDVYPLDEDGLALPSAAETPTGEQAHCVVVDDQSRVYVANKASGTISHFTFSAGTLTPAPVASTSFASARHIFLANEKAYVVSEDQDNLAAFSILPDASLSLDWDRPRLDDGSGTGADIQVTASGRFLYATNRDPENSIVAYDISGAQPVYLGHESTRGDTPRNFAIDPLDEVVIVANHGANKSLAVFSIADDGTLEHQNTLGTEFSPFFVGIVQFESP